MILTLTLTLGVHWAFLQSVAWMGMIVSYSKDASFAEAVSKTFDGKHPCTLCKTIEQGRGEQKKQEQQQINPGSKLELGLASEPLILDFFGSQPQMPPTDFSFGSRSDEPPKPRPRFLS